MDTTVSPPRAGETRGASGHRLGVFTAFLPLGALGPQKRNPKWAGGSPDIKKHLGLSQSPAHISRRGACFPHPSRALQRQALTVGCHQPASPHLDRRALEGSSWQRDFNYHHLSLFLRENEINPWWPVKWRQWPLPQAAEKGNVPRAGLDRTRSWQCPPRLTRCRARSQATREQRPLGQPRSSQEPVTVWHRPRACPLRPL